MSSSRSTAGTEAPRDTCSRPGSGRMTSGESVIGSGMGRSRDLRWDGCLNVRDLGGHRTEDGAETLFGRVVRADSLRQLTDRGWEAAVDYGITTVVELRGDHECDADPPRELTTEVLHVPFMEANQREWEEIEEEIERIKLRAGDALTRTQD